MKKIIMAISVLFVSGCSQNWDVKGVASMDAQGTSFDKSLKNEYVELAIVERYYGDWDSVDRMLTKAINAAEGSCVPLSAPPEGMIKSEEGLKELEAARQKLMAEFKQGARDKKPEASARAQASYGCMVNGWKWQAMSDIAYCESLFDQAMAELVDAPTTVAVEAVETAVVVAPVPTKIVKPVIVSDDSRKVYMENGNSYMVKDGQYIVYYAFGSDKPAQDIDGMLKDVVLEYRIISPEKVAVNGYTDTAGSKQINQALSLRRAKTVANALVKSGIEKEKIETNGYGETNLAVPTLDGVAEPKNRRTTIEFK